VDNPVEKLWRFSNNLSEPRPQAGLPDEGDGTPYMAENYLIHPRLVSAVLYPHIHRLYYDYYIHIYKEYMWSIACQISSSKI
jgi:hypothetical protein